MLFTEIFVKSVKVPAIRSRLELMQSIAFLTGGKERLKLTLIITLHSL